MQQTSAQTVNQRTTWHPKFHFFKDGHWVNDPNGLFYFDNTYHLFFQLNPDNTVWGNIHWGHAVSTDLMHWEHKPTALFAEPDGLGYIFSGGAVVDHHNASGFAKQGETPIIATFTQHSKAEVQVQSMAYSLDGGATFTMYEHNPVLPNPGLKDFRDPKVVWFAQDQVWIKAVVAGQCVHFYRSSDLRSWQKVSEFGQGYGAHGGVWECPDLFPLTCSKTGRELWVLLISINPGGPNGGSATQYFIGHFDGQHFKPLDNETRWLDYGTDCYAGITWDNTPQINTQRTYIAWMSNWLYANKTPDNSWRGAMTLPRTLKLAQKAQGYVLDTTPAVSFASFNWPVADVVNEHKAIALPDVYSMHFALENNGAVTTLSFSNELNEQFIVTIDLQNNHIVADRTQAGYQDNGFAIKASMPLSLTEGEPVQIALYMDTCSFELFVADVGCFTMLLFPNASLNQLAINTNSKTANINNLQIKEIDDLAL
ncbi:glycoside hydrolase family 32 protein [Rheinheimera sp. UJ63]|uniref:glycoside hydrolase family 32 protein n=1 Tax=Rheinheimera sp. UJ63 TaxID=2910157 RepID=UPI001F1C2C83|nr:glycoside hydrolase family 32 protein [Rheinheimera sp. UJ63]MCF4009574.1 glycoside hydrolase family 32 protein [Rheinheimera sp. UJ63]